MALGAIQGDTGHAATHSRGTGLKQKLYIQVFSEDVQLMVFQTKEKINQIRLIRKQDETVVQKITYYIPAGT